MTTISGINNSASNGWTDKTDGKTAASQDAALFRLAQLDANSSGKLSQSEYGTGSASTPQDAARLPPPPAAFATGAASTVSLSGNRTTASATGDASTTDRTLTGRYDLQQLAQQVLRQYDQVSAGASAGSATGATVSKVA